MNIERDEPCTLVSLPFEAVSASRARRMMAAELASAVPSDVMDDAKLVLSELVTNGLQHGSPDSQHNIEVGWCLLDGRVRICVCDAGHSSILEPAAAEPSSERGRGLAIVQTICETLRLDSSGGTRVTAEIAIPCST